MKSLGLLLVLGFLSACGGSTEDAIRENPNVIVGQADRKTRVMAGTYNPSGFSSREVRKLVTVMCASGRLSGFNETANEGIISFSATCSGGFDSTVGLVEFVRDENDLVSIVSIGGDGAGNVVTGKKQVQL